MGDQEEKARAAETASRQSNGILEGKSKTSSGFIPLWWSRFSVGWYGIFDLLHWVCLEPDSNAGFICTLDSLWYRNLLGGKVQRSKQALPIYEETSTS